MKYLVDVARAVQGKSYKTIFINDLVSMMIML